MPADTSPEAAPISAPLKAGREERIEHVGAPCITTRLGDATKAVADDSQVALEGDRPEPVCQLELEEGHDGQLAIANAVSGCRRDAASGLAERRSTGAAGRRSSHSPPGRFRW